MARESTVLTLRVPADLDRRLSRVARASRRTRSATARAILESALAGVPVEDAAAEARRQSKLASGRASDREALEFIALSADVRGWK
jgi:predicted transcriptional regulator